LLLYKHHVQSGRAKAARAGEAGRRTRRRIQVTRRQKRSAALIGVFTAGCFFIWIGFDGWTIESLPAHYLGYVVMAIGIAGLFGVNIWHGGPLDLRDDQKPSEAGKTPKQSE
jgi:hypothetical protein